MLLSTRVPQVSPLLISIILGAILTNTVRVPYLFEKGIAFSSKRSLRLGIVLLGLKVVWADIWALGLPLLLVVISVVVTGIFGTIWMGRLLGVGRKLTLLIACGFSICGAAAVAGADSSIEAEEGDVLTAIALVVIFGTLMIPTLPLLSFGLGMSPEQAGLWAGSSVHEVAQVVAVGEIIGDGALRVAVVTKLSRVLLLAPVILCLNLVRTRAEGKSSRQQTSRTPLVPLFVVGFIAAVLVRSFLPLPEWFLTSANFVQGLLLSAAMFALGCGVKFTYLRKVGAKPFLLAFLATVLVVTVSGIGVAMVA